MAAYRVLERCVKTDFLTLLPAACCLLSMFLEVNNKGSHPSVNSARTQGDALQFYYMYKLLFNENNTKQKQKQTKNNRKLDFPIFDI